MRSLRSTLILASILWTSGLLMLIHMGSLHFVHVFPMPRGRNAAWFVAVAVVLMAAGFVAGSRSLTPFRLLREKLAAVRSGGERRVEGRYPVEIQPLIDELNGLLDDRDKAVKRAFAAAGDLAHGLKTPLAVIAQEAGQTGADSIVQQVDRMSRQVNYQLARARAAASGAAGAMPCAMAPCVEALVRTMQKLHAGKRLEITARVPADLAVRVQPEDLDEILGNLLDNACKWARSRVEMLAPGNGEIMIDDDGPGLPPEARTRVLERGVRLDEAAPGSGLGLAIVRDLCEVYGGFVLLEDAPGGGLRVRLTLPAA